MNFVEELRWRGMIHDLTPGTEEYLAKGMGTAYVGIDPTADSLHIGHLVSVMILKHFQRCGHKPIALVGGATGMIGDPSGKSLERNLLDEDTLRHNQEAIKAQLAHLLDFGSSVKTDGNETDEFSSHQGLKPSTLAPNTAVLVNNYDWMRDITFLDFIRDTGKLLTVNYMMAKDSVKKRFDGEGEGMSFTEFTYQLVQGYDFLHLFEAMDCRMQLGGSDQWGNITTGMELIRRKLGGEAYGLTCPLIKKADGTKFGKTEQGNIWLDASYTSPDAFYQFWLNTSDEDAKSYIKIFTMLDRDEIDALIAEQDAAPHLRPLQKRLAEEVTVMIHSREEYDIAANAVKRYSITAEELRGLDEAGLLALYGKVDTFIAKENEFSIANNQPAFTDSWIRDEAGVNIVDFLVERARVFPSKGELRKLIAGGGVSLNKEKINDPTRTITAADLIANKYLTVQRGKQKHYLIIAE